MTISIEKAIDPAVTRDGEGFCLVAFRGDEEVIIGLDRAGLQAIITTATTALQLSLEDRRRAELLAALA
jgi:hypothetical protein